LVCAIRGFVKMQIFFSLLAVLPLIAATPLQNRQDGYPLSPQYCELSPIFHNLATLIVDRSSIWIFTE
jgi:hypothetical protein